MPICILSNTQLCNIVWHAFQTLATVRVKKNEHIKNLPIEH